MPEVCGANPLIEQWPREAAHRGKAVQAASASGLESLGNSRKTAGQNVEVYLLGDFERACGVGAIV